MFGSIQNIIIAFICSIIAILSVYIYFDELAIKRLNLTLSGYQVGVNILANEANKTTERIVKQIEYIHTQSKPKIIHIQTFVKEINESDCSASKRLLSNYQF